MSHLLIRGNALSLPLADGSVQCVVTSPPYWGLRDYGVDGQLGLEPTPQAYVAAMVRVFREVWRVLRPDGTLWLNIGDSYANDSKWGGQSSPKNGHSRAGGYAGQRKKGKTGLKCKDLVGIPWRLALALQDDGWYLRSEIIWHKPNPMPESIQDRPIKAHEQVFLLSKRERYFYDPEAVKEPVSGNAHTRGKGITPKTDPAGRLIKANVRFHSSTTELVETRNLRSVWTIASNPFRGAHFATMPVKLAAKCIKAGTSQKGCCPACRTPWRRIVEKVRVATRPGTDSKCLPHSDGDLETAAANGWNHPNVIGNRDPQRHCTATRTVGWKPGCGCPAAEPVPCIVFDPFGGAGSTIVAAEALGRIGIATELSAKYLAIARRRLLRPHARHVDPSTTPAEDSPGPLFALNPKDREES